MAFLQKGQYLRGARNQDPANNDQDTLVRREAMTTDALDLAAYDFEKMTTFSLLISPSTKDLGSDPAMPVEDELVVSVLLDPNRPMK